MVFSVQPCAGAAPLPASGISVPGWGWTLMLGASLLPFMRLLGKGGAGWD